MPILAQTTLEKLQQVPTKFWINVGIAIICFIALVYIIRQIRQMNKIVLCIIIAVVFSIVGFSWIYERNEPAFLSPVVDVIAPFFPAKGSYQVTQKKEPEAPKGAKPSPAQPPAKKP